MTIRRIPRRQFLAASGATAIVARPLAKLHAEDRSVPASRPIYLTDLDRCQPSDRLSRHIKRDTWRKLAYGTENFSGTMLVATQESRSPVVTYPLDRDHWYQIYIGIYRKPFEESKQVQVKLTGDPAFTTITGRAGDLDHAENWIDDVYWKTADLTGQGVVFRQILEPVVQHAWVAYIKLIPLNNDQVRTLQADRRRQDTKRLFVHTDAHFTNLNGSKQYLQNYLEPLRNTDVARIYWEAGGGDQALYFSRIAETYDHPLSRQSAGQAEPAFPRTFDRELAETWMAYRQQGNDPLRIAAEFVQEIGLELHASYRTSGFVYPPPHDELRGTFFRQHPELLCVSKDGQPMPRISYAYPEVRRYVLSMFREMANYPIDGVCLLYNRRPPLVAYEPPLVAGFRRQFGKDPRELDEHDPDWLTYRSHVLTDFMRELRQEMDAVASEQPGKKRLAVSAVVFREEENLLHGMDLATWIQEGLVDTIIPYSSSVRLNSFAPAWEQAADIAYFVSLVQGTACRLAPNLMPRSLSPENYRELASRLYDAGVEELFFWDGIERVRRATRLGHQDEVKRWVNSGQPAIKLAATRLKTMAGWDLQTETPG